jgi:glycerophosphoryl diester phosphodiesterase
MIGRSMQARRGPTLLKYVGVPMYIAHRGGALMYPENTTEGFTASMAAGNDLMECDAQFLSDGTTLAVMHDTTVDALTTSTGAVNSFNAAAWAALAIDADTWHGSNFGNALAPTTIPAVITQTKAGAIILPEAKVFSTGTSIVAALLAAGIRPESAVVQSFDLASLASAVTHGYRALFLTPTGTDTKATILAAGVSWVGIADGLADAIYTGWIAAGFRVFVYSVNRRYRRDQLAALGVVDFFSDDPAYVTASAALRTTDNFASGTWSPGMFGLGVSLAAGTRGRFSGADYWGFSATGFSFLLQGYLCPVANPTSFTFDFKMTIDSTTNGTRWGSVWIGTSDYPYDDTANGVSSGYHILMRKSGSLEIFRRDAGVIAAVLVTQATAAIADGVETSYRITITATHVSVDRLTGTTGTASVADATYRGAYITLGRNDAALRWRDLAVA